MRYRTKIRHGRKAKMTAVMLMVVFACQLIYPNLAFGLTTGPSQPEVQGFEPVGTTDMVDMFSGGFVYNIPLMDVEGYPVNISYHGGVSMEQEASWVGLGWNINPGVINRSVRGIPDDCNGDVVARDLHIRPENTLRAGIGISPELFGTGGPFVKLQLSLGLNVNISNYSGVSSDFDLGCGVNFGKFASAGINIGVGSQSGASVDANASAQYQSSRTLGKDISTGIGISGSSGYSTRVGIKSLNFGITLDASQSRQVQSNDPKKKKPTYERYGKHGGINSNCSVPIGVSNYVPVITNSSFMRTVFGRIKLGAEVFGIFFHMDIRASFSRLTYENDASRPSYGYMYMQNARLRDTAILDFTRDKDGMFNESMRFLPVPNMTYDIFNVSGQGTGGVFRAFRNDFGSVYDPYTRSYAFSDGGEPELGAGNAFEGGLDYTMTGTIITSGPWKDYKRDGMATGFKRNSKGSLYENVYFKQAGEMTAVDPSYFSAIGGENPITPGVAKNLPDIKPNSAIQRDVRANLIYYHTAEQDTVPGVGSNANIISYTDPTFSTYPDNVTEKISRIGIDDFQRKKDQISEIVQVQNDGRKYVYATPAMNNAQREVTFTVDPNNGNTVDLDNGTVKFGGDDATKNNSKGRDHYYNSSVTSSYAHSYLLTSVLSSDYRDVTGNGISDDDLGSFTKFNYTRTDSDYRWIAPFSDNVGIGAATGTAQYSPGFWSDRLDDKGSFLVGSREQWNLHSIETKNYIAEFYTSERDDALGISDAILNTGESYLLNHPKPSGKSSSYKLDSIKLYNKHDRVINGIAAVPVKTVFFVYDYSLCDKVPNSVGNVGKLTLRKIYFRYGNSQKSMTSPYSFKYDNNPKYDAAAKDRWGTYKPNDPSLTNYEFPYLDQNDRTANNKNASAWGLALISLPSGGTIQAEYESNDYAFVQDRPANEMFLVKGLGNSPSFMPGSLLQGDLYSPNLYAYFVRRPAEELPNLSFAQNYLGKDFNLKGENCIYFNFNVALTDANSSYEQIKGYAKVVDIGTCGNDGNYGYIKFESKIPTSGGANLHPITFTSLNVGRYNLPQVIYPGQDPEATGIKPMLAGLKGAFKELGNIGKSPIVYLAKKGGGKKVNLRKCFIRLQNVGLHKQGGGQRVKTLSFYDQWNTLAGGNAPDADYGKQYFYIKQDSTGYGKISSGVASYEPIIGGDENPLRQPIPYQGQSRTAFPPNDAVDLYQETPIGESLFPPGQVGYSSVYVVSSHLGRGNSSRGLDAYEFYTAKDFPAQFLFTPVDAQHQTKYSFFSSKNMLTATQGYTLIFNNMHGKPKRVEHDKFDLTTGLWTPVSYQEYKYKQNGNRLDNNVPCLVFDGSNMVVQQRQLGVEEDITLDSREKKEVTENVTVNGNLNFFFLPFIIPIPVPIPLGFGWGNDTRNQFQCAAVTKVIQQYGILDNITSYSDGAETVMRNEIYDPMTGQPVVTSVTNEFLDKEYTTTIPAYWVYNGMSHSYTNIDYRDEGTISIGNDHIGTLSISNATPLYTGDELAIRYTDTAGNIVRTNAWVIGNCGGVRILPRFPLSTMGWDDNVSLSDVSIRVISSGHKNMLEESVESYTAMKSPINGSNILDTALTDVINISAKTFGDSTTGIIRDFITYPQAANPFAIGERGIWRPLSDYAYHSKRNYSGVTARSAGLFSASSLFTTASGVTPPPCTTPPYKYLAPTAFDNAWHKIRTITKWSPFGKEVENIDAIGNYSTALYSYNEELPVAVAANVRQGNLLAEGFEDYNLLWAKPNMMNFHSSIFSHSATEPLSTPSLLYDMISIPPNVMTTVAHTGMYSYFTGPVGTPGSGTPGSSGNDTVVVPIAYYPNGTPNKGNHYNDYYPGSGGSYYSSNNEYQPFQVQLGRKYILNYWVHENSVTPGIIDYTFNPGVGVLIDGTILFPAVKKTNIIEGWQQVEVVFNVPIGSNSVEIKLPKPFYIDDVRLYPAEGNMKAFVYGPNNPALPYAHQKLMATLDENNFATLYEYDREGNLVRTKKETNKGIMTISESRSGNPKQ